eukprot:4104270-Lingulodinium_polyedra.AAC.1
MHQDWAWSGHQSAQSQHLTALTMLCHLGSAQAMSTSADHLLEMVKLVKQISKDAEHKQFAEFQLALLPASPE